jgi:hypothetical protein
VADPVGLQGSQHVCRSSFTDTHLARLACCTAPKYDCSPAGAFAGAFAGAGKAEGLCGVEHWMGGKGLLSWWYAAMVLLAGLDEAISSATLGSVGRAGVDSEASCSGRRRCCQSVSMVGM